MDYTRELAGFCSAVSIDRLPPEVIHKTKLCVLDYVANVYGSLELDAVRNVVDYIRSQDGPAVATALGCGFRTSVQNAAFLNGTTAEAIEAQDGLRFGGNHPGTAVIPAALAVAEAEGLEGSRVIEAIVAGYEAANRAAASVHPWHTLSGFLPTGTCGTFGAAAAVARMRGYDTDKMLNTLGIAGYILPISMAEQLMGGFTIKIVQGGQAASAGILAAGLAQAGLSGATYVLEGSPLKGGFSQITVKAEPKLEKITENLGSRYSIMDIYFKPYTSCRHTHGAIQATLEILEQQAIEVKDIRSIDVFTYGIAVIAVGKGVTKESTFVSAQFSIPYCVAACLMDRELGPRQLTEGRIADPVLIELAGRVNVQMDEVLNKAYPDVTSSRVEISLSSGETLIRQIDIPMGDPRVPMEAEELSAKVTRFSGIRDRGRTAGIIDMALNLDDVTRIGDFTQMI
ncbi:MAG: MmgE/PrpD family protein [Desulfomonilia bacterium]